MNNDLKEEYTNEGDKEEQVKEEKTLKFQKIFIIIVISMVIFIMLSIMFKMFSIQ